MAEQRDRPQITRIEVHATDDSGFWADVYSTDHATEPQCTGAGPTSEDAVDHALREWQIVLGIAEGWLTRTPGLDRVLAIEPPTGEPVQEPPPARKPAFNLPNRAPATYPYYSHGRAMGRGVHHIVRIDEAMPETIHGIPLRSTEGVPRAALCGARVTTTGSHQWEPSEWWLKYTHKRCVTLWREAHPAQAALEAGHA
jgi:hypothetical protein